MHAPRLLLLLLPHAYREGRGPHGSHVVAQLLAELHNQGPALLPPPPAQGYDI